MNFGMKHAPSTGSIAQSVNQQSSALSMYVDCSTIIMMIVTVTMIVMVTMIVTVTMIYSNGVDDSNGDDDNSEDNNNHCVG